ncbi:MAG: hypothetical protein V4486_00660 [Patescibacteria group bacterium]
MKNFRALFEAELEGTDGQATIIGARELLPTKHIDPRFEAIHKSGPATPPTKIQVQELAVNGELLDLLQDVSAFDTLPFMQSQIVQVCHRHPDWLQANGMPNLFLCKMGEANSDLFVVSAFLDNWSRFFFMRRELHERILWRGRQFHLRFFFKVRR